MRRRDIEALDAEGLRALCRRLLARAPKAPLLSHCIKEFTAHRQAVHGTTPATLYRYRAVVRWLIAHLGDRAIDEYDQAGLEATLLSDETFRGSRPCSWTMRRYRVEAARTLWRYALAHGYLSVDTMAGIEVEGEDVRHLPAELPLDTLRIIIAEARLRYRRRLWLADSIALLALTCLRPSELWRLSWQHVELAGPAASRLLLDGEVRRKNPTPALYPLCPEAAEIFETWRRRTLLVIGTSRMANAPCLWSEWDMRAGPHRLNTNLASHLFTRLTRRIGARCLRGEHPTLYTLRHFYQQLFEGKANLDVRMRLMGHTSPTIGPRHYMSAMEEEQREVVSRFPRLA